MAAAAGRAGRPPGATHPRSPPPSLAEAKSGQDSTSACVIRSSTAWPERERSRTRPRCLREPGRRAEGPARAGARSGARGPPSRRRRIRPPATVEAREHLGRQAPGAAFRQRRLQVEHAPARDRELGELAERGPAPEPGRALGESGGDGALDVRLEQGQPDDRRGRERPGSGKRERERAERPPAPARPRLDDRARPQRERHDDGQGQIGPGEGGVLGPPEEGERRAAKAGGRGVEAGDTQQADRSRARARGRRRTRRGRARTRAQPPAGRDRRRAGRERGRGPACPPSG